MVALGFLSGAVSDAMVGDVVAGAVTTTLLVGVVDEVVQVLGIEGVVYPPPVFSMTVMAFQRCTWPAVGVTSAALATPTDVATAASAAKIAIALRRPRARAGWDSNPADICPFPL